MVRLFFFLPIGMIAISTASIFIKLCDAPSLITAAYRMALASLLLLPFAGCSKVWRNWTRRDVRWLSLSGVLLSLHFATWITSLRYTSVASSVVLVTTYPIFVGLGGWLFLQERIGLNLALGILFSVLGSALISFGDMGLSHEALIGDGLALLGALMASGYILVGKKMRKRQDLLSYIFPVYAIAGGVLILFALLARKSFFGYPPSTYLLFFLLALIPQLIGHTTFNWALRYLPASVVSVTVLAEPVGSTLLAYLVLGERLTPLKVTGGMFIFAGILAALMKAADIKRKGTVALRN